MYQDFPKLIYVMEEDGGDEDPYLKVFKSTEEFEGITESTPIAVYKLVEIGEVEVTREYVRDEEAKT